MTFAFLLHPLTARYVDRGTWLTRPLPSFLVNKLILLKKPYKVAEFSVKGLKGYFIGCLLTSEQMLNLNKDFVLKRIIQTCDEAERLGAKIISLGAFSAIATDQGNELIGKVNINITTGRAYTVAVVYEQIKRVFNKNKKIAIVGANGAIGKGLIKLLKRDNHQGFIEVNKCNFSEMYKADLIVSTTNTTKELLEEKKLRSNSTIIDVSKPSAIRRNIKRRDITIIEGGLVRLPHDVDIGINFDCPKNVVFACMAEPMILDLEGKYENYSIGENIPLEKIEQILNLGTKWGFSVL